MAENKLEGFEDFDNILGEGGEGGEGEGGAAAFAGELDDLLGADAGAGGEAAAEGGAAPGGDSELDSFFEDLSTIDDLEVLQEEEAPAPAEAAAEPAEEPETEEPAPAPRAAAPAVERARPQRAPREPRKRGFFGRLIRWLILLAILGGIGYFVYQFFFPDLQPPWQVMEQQKGKLMSMVQEKLQKPPPAKPVQPPPPPPPPVVMQPKPKPHPVPKAPPAPPKEHGPWSIQVATCFFPSCLDSYRAYLTSQKRSVLVRDRVSQSEALEIYSISNWRDKDEAQQLADRVNRENPLEGHAFIFHDDGGYRISMGAFSDLSRANVVKDALNQQYRGEMVFATRVKTLPYKLQSVLTGRYPTRAAAEASLEALKNAEPRLKDAFVTRNQ